MSLQEKVLKLKMDAVIAARHAAFWQKAIDEHGEEKATRFYTHLGLNHLEKKSFEWEGLKLSREPKEHEKIAVKGIANAQESAKESIGTVLLALRLELIEDGLKGIKKLKPARYHELTLQASEESRSGLRDRLILTHRQGRMLVARELSHDLPKGLAHEADCNKRFPFSLNESAYCECVALWGDVTGRAEVRGRVKAGNALKAAAEDEFDDLDELTDLTDARIANDVQSRIIAAATRYRLLGLVGAELLAAVQNEITAGTVTYIDRAATGLANKVLNLGRMDEMERRSGDIQRYAYSALLDQNTCPICFSDDGKEADTPDDLPDAPNPECEGSDFCRCFIVAIAD